MIEPTYFRRLKLTEKQNFVRQFLPPVDRVLGSNPEYIPYVDRVKGDYSLFLKSTEEVSHPELTEEVNMGDNMRDGGINGVKGNATRSVNRSDPKWVAAGTTILRAFHEFGDGMANLPLDQETSCVENLLAEIDRNADLRAAITTIQSDAWLQDIRDGQKIVTDATDKRIALNAANSMPSTFDVAKSLSTSIDKLVSYINLKLEFEPKPELVSLANELNEIIAHYKQLYRQRQTLREQEQQKLDQK